MVSAENMHEKEGEEWTVRMVRHEKQHVLQADGGVQELVETPQPMSEVAVAQKMRQSPPIAALEALVNDWSMYSAEGLGTN